MAHDEDDDIRNYPFHDSDDGPDGADVDRPKSADFIQCPRCKKYIYAEAVYCPKCRYCLLEEPQRKPLWFILTVIIILVIILLFWVLGR